MRSHSTQEKTCFLCSFHMRVTFLYPSIFKVEMSVSIVGLICMKGHKTLVHIITKQYREIGHLDTK